MKTYLARAAVFLAALLPLVAFAGTEDRPQGVAVRIWGQATVPAGQSGSLNLYGTFMNPDPSVGGDQTLSVTTNTASGGTVTTNLGANTNGIVRVEPGKAYQLMVGGSNFGAGEINIIPPAGYHVLIDGMQRTRDLFNGAWDYYFQVVADDTQHPRAAGHASGVGATAIEWHAALGQLLNGTDAGVVSLIDAGTRTDWSPIYAPSMLSFESATGEVSVYRIWDTLRQIISDQVAVDVVTLSSGYELRFYSPSQLTGTSAPYSFTGVPFVTYRVQQGATATTLSFTREVRDVTDTTTNFPISRTEVMSLAQSQAWPNTIWNRSPWTLQGQTPSNQTVDTSNGTATTRSAETLDVQPSGGGSNTIETHRTYTNVPNVGEFVATETLGSGGNNPVSTYNYYTDAGNPQVLGYLQSATYADGGWDGYDYNGSATSLATSDGTIQHRYRPFVNTPATPSFNPGVGEVTSYSYTNDEFGAQRAPSLIETRVNSVITARTAFAYHFETRYANNHGINRIERTDYSADTTSMTSVVCVYMRNWGDDIYRGELFSVTTPDQVRKAYAYEKGDWNASTNTFTPGSGTAARVTEITGTATSGAGTFINSYNGQDIEDIYLVDGKSVAETTIRDNRALMVRHETAVWSGGAWIQTGWTNYSYDMAGNLTQRVSSNGATYEASYSGGLKQWERDEQGVLTSYTYDSAGRVDTATRQGAGVIGTLVFKYTYDPAGNRTQEIVGWGQSEQIIASAQFDNSGRVISETAPGLSPRTHAYDVANRTHTITEPTGGTTVETYNVDAELASVTGTGVVPVYRTYGVESDGRRFTQVSAGSASSPRYAKQWMDWLGRTIERKHPGFTGQPDADEQYFYDSVGRLVRATRNGYADQLFQYNILSQLNRAGLDINHNGTLDLASGDRIADADTYLESYSGAYWLRTDAKVYGTANSAAATNLITVRYRLTNFPANRLVELQRVDGEGNTTVITFDANRSGQTATRTETRSGISGQRTTSYVDGFPRSVTDFAGLTTTFGYDSLLRQTTVTDSRNNTTTTGYVSGTMRPSTVTDASNAQTALGYDNAGRLTWRRDQRNYYTRFEYNLRNQIVHQWGDGAYPVEFGYDATYGDRLTMSTFRGGSGWEGATWPGSPGTPDTTTWSYDAPSGLISSKTDALGRTASQTYNLRGQTATRTLARNVTATYSYDGNTGELTGISYSDGTPAVTTTYTRIGQLDSVADATGAHDYLYDAAKPWRLTNEVLDTFYGGKTITRLFENAGVLGRNDGFKLGSGAGSNSDLEQDYGYLGNGRFETVTSGANGNASTRTFRYSYLSNAALISGLSIDGSHPFTVTRAYEATRDLLTSIASKWSTATRTQFDYAYDERAMMKSMVQSGDVFSDYGDATHRLFTYNGRGELTTDVGYLNGNPADQSLPMPGRHYEFAYDNAGNRTTSNHTGVAGLAENYVTNAANQYVSRENNAVSVSGTADAASAVAVKAQPAAAGRQGRYWSDEVPVNNAQHPWYGTLTVFTAKPGAGAGGSDLYRMDTRTSWLAAALQTFSYDNDGNLISDGLWDYTYDAENRLTSMQTTSVAVSYGFPNRLLQFKYDFAGRRVQKRVVDLGSNTEVSSRRYLYDGTNLVAEFNAPGGTTLGSMVRSYTWGLDLAGVRRGGAGALLQIRDQASGNTYLPTYDAHGNLVSLINASTGSAAAVYEYSPYGEFVRAQVNDSTVADQPFRFSTQFYDVETGLYCYLRRYYDPKTGRWLSRDPAEEAGGLNLYGYCSNNPLNHFDAFGEDDGYGGSYSSDAVMLDPYVVTADRVPSDTFYVTGDAPVQVGQEFSTPDGTTWYAQSSGGIDENGMESLNVVPVGNTVTDTPPPPAPDISSDFQQQASDAVAAVTADIQDATNQAMTDINASIQADAVATANQSLQDASSDFATRFSGGLEAMGGVIEAAAGTALAAAASWTGIGLLAGGAVAAHGFDVALAGLQQAVTGQSTDSLTSDALQSAGLSRSTANAIDSGISFAGSLGSASVAASISAAESASADIRLVIGRGADLATPGSLAEGETTLKWVPTGSAQTEWKTNSSLLRTWMNELKPIRDASPGDTGGMYLNAERNLLMDRGWTFDPSTNLWMPPEG